MLKILLFFSLALTGFCEDLDVGKVSEAIGHMIGKNLQSLGLDLNLDAIVKGLKEEAEGETSPLSEDECVQAIAVLQEEKISAAADQELQKADAISNGDQIQDNEGRSIPTSDPSEYR